MPDDIDDFLRRVMERKQQRQAQPPSRPAEPAPRPERVAPAEVVRETPAAPLGGSLAQHVARSFETSDFTSHTEQLGSMIAAADDRLESHLHQVFDHELSSFVSKTSTETDAAALHLAQAPLRAALRSPQTLRQAILASEVLRRPEHLWE